MERLRKFKSRVDMSTFSHYVTLGYNCSQVVAWLFVLMWQLPTDRSLTSPRTYLDIAKWKMDHYWDGNANDEFSFWLWYAQSLQAWDIVFCAFGITNNKLFNVLPQIVSRLFILWGIFPYVPAGHYAVFGTCMCWSFTEVVRFTYYTIK